jgi:hypothetical protein
VAKKVRRKLEEEEAAAFEFPAFDEAAFVRKEFELGMGLVLAGVLAIVAGFACWTLTVSGVPWWGPFLLGLLFVAITPIVIGRIRPSTRIYTKGDWAGLIALVFFSWLALWFVLVNVVSTPI